MRLIQLVFNSKLFLQWPSTLLKRCCQNMMQRYTSSLYMNVSGFSLKCAYMTYFAYLKNCMFNISFSAMDGDQLVDFYWIDPMLTAERIAAKSQYAGHMYYQFEPEESWDRPGVRAFGRINGGLVFEAAYIIDPTSVPLLSVFYADKSHNKGMSHHPVYRKCLFYIYCIFCV